MTFREHSQRFTPVFQKAHGTPIPYMEFFWGGPQNFFAPSNRPFFRSTNPFQKLRAQIPKIEGPGCERSPGASAVVDDNTNC